MRERNGGNTKLRRLYGGGWWCGLEPRVHGNLFYVMRRSGMGRCCGVAETRARARKDRWRTRVGRYPGSVDVLGYQRESRGDASGGENPRWRGWERIRGIKHGGLAHWLRSSWALRAAPSTSRVYYTSRCIPTIPWHVHPLSVRRESDFLAYPATFKANLYGTLLTINSNFESLQDKTCNL